MTDLPDPDGALDDAQGARRALNGPVEADADVLAAVQQGLLGVPAGAPASWFDVPTQRTRLRGSLAPRRR